VDGSSPNFDTTQGDHRRVINVFQNSDVLLRFQTRVAQSRVILKMRPNFALFDPPVQIRGGMGEISVSINEASPTTEPPEYI